MSDCHKELLNFSNTLSLSDSEVERLRASRDAVAKKIHNYFLYKNNWKPEFKGQGSFTMGTIIRPLSGSYDLDLGVYFSELTGRPSNWPTTETIHKHIVNSVSGHYYYSSD